MKPLPQNWVLVEEWEGSFVFENSDHSFYVHVDFDEKLKLPYTISYEQIEGDYELIDFDGDIFSTSAFTQAEGLDKAMHLMNFINVKINGSAEE